LSDGEIGPFDWSGDPPWDDDGERPATDEPFVPDGVTMYAQRDNLAAELRATLDDCFRTGYDHAIADNKYRVARAKLTRDMRESGTPVTLIDKLIFNDEEVAMLKLKSDMSDVKYKVTLEALNVVKILVRQAEGDINRDYSSRQ
jgi:hypothetical protein